MTRFRQPKRKRAFRCRCRKCEHRVFMEHHPDSYARGLQCQGCGVNKKDRAQGWRVDWYRTAKAEAKRQGVCECMQLPFPHRPTSAFKTARCQPGARPGTRSHSARRAA